MIQRLCPDGVEYKKFADVCNYEQPTKYIVHSINYSDEYDTPVLTAGQSFILGYTNEVDGVYNASKENPVIIFDDFTGAFKWVNFPFKVKSSAMKMLTSNDDVLLRYVFHYMGVLNFSSSEHTRLWIGTYSNFEIPVPPLEVQRKIVEVLDNFSELTAELTAELEARRKQYEYYRDSLLNFSQITPPYPLKWMTMSEICKSICSGGTPNTSIKEYYDGNIPWLRTQEVDWNEIYDTQIKISELAIKQSSAKIIPVHCVIVAMYGATAAKACINRIPLATNQACCNLIINSAIAHYKYVYYYINSQYENIKSMGEGSQSNISSKKIKKLLIPIPPLSEQNRIVSILDRFEALTTDLTSGLPAEIKARQQQYEYYRDQLLTFKRAN